MQWRTYPNKPAPHELVKLARDTAEKTGPGREVVIDWPAGVDYFDAMSAKQAVVDGGTGFWRNVSNGYGGYDRALIKAGA